MIAVCNSRYLEKPIHIVCWACMTWSSVGKFFCWPWSMIAYLTIQRCKGQIEKLCFSSTFRWESLIVWIGLLYDNITHVNLPREERQALNSLRQRTDITIKPADKGSAVVVTDRQKYIDEARRQLNDRTSYRLLDSDPTDTFSQQIQHTLDDIHAREVITDKAYECLSPTYCKPARFYHQPKLHKESIPGLQTSSQTSLHLF